MAETHDWEEQQRILLQRWPALDERGLRDTNGDREGILALLEGRLGYARANAERDYDELMSGESSVPKDVADDKQHTGTSGPVGDVHGSFDEQGRERTDVGGGRGDTREHAGSSTSRSTNAGQASMPASTATDAKQADTYAEGSQGAARLESDNSDTDGKTVPPDMASDEGDQRLRRAG
jgi:hypothetical protein